jgi:glycosyltransferase involved in cell wall biosynthesis
MEATRVTGVARNVLDYAKLARIGVGGLQISFTFAVIRRGRVEARPCDGFINATYDARLPAQLLFERHRYDALLLAGIQRLVDTHQPDIVETHHVKSHCLLALSGLWRRYQWVAFHHGYTETSLRVRAHNHLDRWSLRRAAHVVTTNYRFARLLRSRGLDRGTITVLHNAVRDMQASDAEVDALRRRFGLSRADRVVLSVGRLSREKGQEHLVRAAVGWPGRPRLVIVGDGPDRPRLERLTRELGCADTVVFAGLTPNVAPFYQLADVFVLPSLSEGSPNVLLEAMAAGLPIVATDVGGIPEIVADGVNALLVPPRDVEALACAVKMLLSDLARCERLGSVARFTVSQRYTPEKRAAALAGVYARLAGPLRSRQCDDGACCRALTG